MPTDNPQSPKPLLRSEPPKALAVVKNTGARIVFSDGTEIYPMPMGGFMGEPSGEAWCVARPNERISNCYSTMRDAIMSLGLDALIALAGAKEPTDAHD